MTLSFVSAGMLVFTTLGAVPIVLHFFKRGRAEPVMFPAVMFLEGSARRVTSEVSLWGSS